MGAKCSPVSSARAACCCISAVSCTYPVFSLCSSFIDFMWSLCVLQYVHLHTVVVVRASGGGWRIVRVSIQHNLLLLLGAFVNTQQHVAPPSSGSQYWNVQIENQRGRPVVRNGRIWNGLQNQKVFFMEKKLCIDPVLDLFS